MDTTHKGAKEATEVKAGANSIPESLGPTLLSLFMPSPERSDNSTLTALFTVSSITTKKCPPPAQERERVLWGNPGDAAQPRRGQAGWLKMRQSSPELSNTLRRPTDNLWSGQARCWGQMQMLPEYTARDTRTQREFGFSSSDASSLKTQFSAAGICSGAHLQYNKCEIFSSSFCLTIQ